MTDFQISRHANNIQAVPKETFMVNRRNSKQMLTDRRNNYSLRSDILTAFIHELVATNPLLED